MALQFKRTRLDAAQQRTFPNSKEEVIFRNDVSNKNLLQNPFRTSGIPVGPVGVQNRPVNPMVDDRGAMYGGSVSVLRKGVSNSNLLHNPYRFKTDSIDDPRTLTRQVINDINSGKAPQYIRENKGIDEIAFMIVKALPDNGVKLATLSMLKSYITGMRLQSVLDQGGQNVTKAFDVLNQLVVTSKSLYRTGMLGIKLPALLLQYSENIAKIFGDTVLQPVSPILMFTAIQDLASVSSILTKLFRAQNSVSTPTNVSIDEWAKAEAAKIQALRQQQEQQTLPPPTPQVDATGDNHPTGTEGVKDPNNIKQEGTGKMSKKKKIPKTGSGLSVNWGIANPKSAVSLIEEPSNLVTPLPPSNFQPPPNIVNVMPIKDPVSVKIIGDQKSTLEKVTDVGGFIAGTAIPLILAGINVYSAVMDRGEAAKRDKRDELRHGFEKNQYKEAADSDELRQRLSQDYFTLNDDHRFIMDHYNYTHGLRHSLSVPQLQRDGFLPQDIQIIISGDTPSRQVINLLDILLAKQAEGITLKRGEQVASRGASQIAPDSDPFGSVRTESVYHGKKPSEAGPVLPSEVGQPSQLVPQPRRAQRFAAEFENPLLESKGQIPVIIVPERPERPPKGVGMGRNRKSKKSTKSTIKKSKNLDAQILALLRA
jgi:hypothetical protein